MDPSGSFRTSSMLNGPASRSTGGRLRLSWVGPVPGLHGGSHLVPSLPTWESTAGDNGARGSQPFFRDARRARQMPGPEFGYNLLPGLGLFGLSHLLVLVFPAVLTQSRQVRLAHGRAAHRWLVTVPADALGLPFLVPEGPLLLDVCLLFSWGRTVLVAIFLAFRLAP